MVKFWVSWDPHRAVRYLGSVGQAHQRLAGAAVTVPRPRRPESGQFA